MANKQGNNILHNIWVPLYFLSILIAAILLLLVACGGETLYLDDPPGGKVSWEYARRACMEYGYPEAKLFSDGTVFCIKQSTCTDIVMKLDDLIKKRGQ
jgi:hypothetical protein